MSDATFQSEVLETLRQTREAELAWMDSLSTDERNAIGTLENWSDKDALAHVLTWKRIQAERLAAALRGETPQRHSNEEVDQLNAEVYAEHQHRSWEEVSDEAAQAYEALLRETAALSAEELAEPSHFEWQRNEPLWQSLLSNGAWHPLTHFADSARRRGDAADLARFQTALLTGTEKLIARLDEIQAPPEAQGNTIYNLACAYATDGKTEQALGLLPRAFELNPQLIAWSHEDPDLVEVRKTPEYQRLAPRAD